MTHNINNRKRYDNYSSEKMTQTDLPEWMQDYSLDDWCDYFDACSRLEKTTVAPQKMPPMIVRPGQVLNITEQGFNEGIANESIVLQKGDKK